MTTTHSVSPLDGIVTRPDHFDPTQDYALVVARGDNPLGDYDIIDAQQILRYDMATFGVLLVQEGAIVSETGGTVGVPQQGPIVGGDQLAAGGQYVGVQSQVYTVKVLSTGAGGVATYTWTSSGIDNPSYANQSFAVKAVAPPGTDPTLPSNIAQYGCPVGSQGVMVIFENSTGQVHGGSSWSVQATYGAQPPVIQGDSLVLTDAIVFLNGRVQRLKGKTLTYPAATPGMASIVYGEWLRVLVSNTDDATLTDPLSNQSQAYRERWTMTFQASDTSGLALPAHGLERRVVALYRWDRDTDAVSQVQPIPYNIDLSKTTGSLPAARLVNVDQSVLLGGLLSERTLDANGDFVVTPTGGNPRAYSSTNPPSTSGKFRVTIPPVTAYIQGIRFESDMPQDIELDQATDTGTVLGEPHTMQAGQSLYLLNKAGLTPSFPIASIIRCTGNVAVNQESVLRSSASLSDALSLAPVVSITRAYLGPSGAPTTTYQQKDASHNTPGTYDYELSLDSVLWQSGHGPTAGTNYNVDYIYNRTFVAGGDYVLTGGSIDFSPAGPNPVVGTVFYVDYSYFLYRTDGVMIRPTGEIAVVRGTAQPYIIQPVLPLYALCYCLISVAPGGSTITVTPYNNDAVTMVALNNMRDQIGFLTNDVARLNLANQAHSKQSTAGANLIDIITDAFTGTDVADMTYSTTTPAVTADATIDTTAQLLTLPYTQQIVALTPTQPGSGTPGTQLGKFFYALPHTDEVAINAPLWSADYPCNPYSDFRAEPPTVQITPDRDFWIDTISLSSTSSRIVENGRHESWNIVGAFTTTQTQVRDIPYLYMRQIGITCTVQFLVPGENVRCQMDGKDCGLTAQGGSLQVDGFTIQASLNTSTDRGGTAVFSYTVPANVPSGTAPVVIYGDNAAPGSVWPSGYAVRATCTFTSTGEVRLITTETVITLVQNDPVAQSVIFPSPRMISKVTVPIASTPPHVPTSPPLLCEVRATDQSGEASAPIHDVLAQVSKPPSAWASSGDAVFLDPVYTPANIYRAIVLRSSSNLYRVYVSQLGGPNRVSGGFITADQIPSGIFMDSSNNSDWTLRQDWDLRCTVSVAKMTATSGYLYYLPVTVAGGAATGIFLAVDQNAPDACSIQWQYSLDNGTTWTNFNAFAITNFPTTAATIIIRAHLTTSDVYSSPVIHAANACLQILSNKAAGVYVTKALQVAGNVTNAQAPHVAGQYDAYLPQGATAKLYLSQNNGVTWTGPVTTTQDPLPGPDQYTTFHFNQTGLPAPSSGAGQVRVRLDLAATNPAQPPSIKRLYAYAMPT